MKQYLPPKGTFSTTFGVAFNYEVKNNSFLLILPEGREIFVRTKPFNKVIIHLIPFKISFWAVDLKSSIIKRKEPCHEASKVQVKTIEQVLESDFNKFYQKDLFLAEKFRRWQRYKAIQFLLSDRTLAEENVEFHLNRIKQINSQLEEYL